MSLPTEKDIDDAIKRIALSSDGELLYRRLQMVLMEVPPLEPSGALQSNHGRRLLARELKLLMDEELSKRASERVRPDGQHDPDRPAIQRAAKPVSVDAGGVRRRVADYPDAGHFKA